jgi:phosphomethylpyrimidine synthase
MIRSLGGYSILFSLFPVQKKHTNGIAMTTLLDFARQGIITPRMDSVARNEQIDPAIIRERIVAGTVVIMHKGDVAVGIGEGLRTKINVNLGTSTNCINPSEEVEKALIAEKYGADTISDLSMGGDIDEIRREILRKTNLPVTTVPIYQTAAECGLGAMTAGDILETIRTQARDGVSSMVLHCVNTGMLEMFRQRRRILGMVSKGGAITGAFMRIHDCENPFIRHFDEILGILKEYDIVLSLGNTARSGCIHDLPDEIQREELRQNRELAYRAHSEGVQAIVEGAGGHIRTDRIRDHIRYYKENMPFPLFVAGPLPTDTAFGYDHIAGCVGASIASGAGADYLCAITPAEHLGLPGPGDVKEGLIAFRIAAYIGDSLKYGRDEKDKIIAEKRAVFDREGQICLALDQERAEALSSGNAGCTMCGEFCAIKLMKLL